ncbi:unnamed protein product, partial [Brenthis ino]
MFKVIVVLIASISVAYAALAIASLQPKPEKFKDQEGCYIRELDQVIPFGGTAPSKSACMRYFCGEKIVQHETCGVKVAAPPCTLVTDKTKPYPDCCPQLSC